ncbi:MAG: LptF/LptG family permease [Bacteroidota bacterium]
MTRFDWHVLRRFVAGTALLLVLLIATFVVLHFAERVDDFLDRGAETGQILRFYLYYVPDIIRLTSPLALFLAAIYVTARLAQSMQLTAVRMAGVSLWRYMRPFVLFGLLFTGAMLVFNGFVVPRATAVVLEFENQYYRDAPEGAGASEIVRQAAPGVILTAGFYDRREAQAFRVSLVTIADTSGTGVRARLDAQDMAYVDSLGVWRAKNVVARQFDLAGRERFAVYESLDTTLAVLPRDLAQSDRDADRLTLPEARAFVQSLERAGVQERGRPLVSYYNKVAYPVANLVLVLLAVPLAARRRRGGQAAQLALGLGVAFVYLAFQKTIEPLGYVQTIPPLVATWLPHVVFGGLALWLLVRARRV